MFFRLSPSWKHRGAFAAAQKELNDLYQINADQCCELAQNDNGLPFSDVVLADWLRKIYESGGDTGLHQASINAFADAYMEALQEGYMQKPNYSDKDLKMIKNLRNNTYTFSAAKNAHELKLLTGAILDEKGNVRSFGEFKKAADAITKISRTEWLRAEYNLAVAGSQMASKWADYEPGDLLRYSTAGDARVRDTHRALDGVTKPMEDTFWDTHFPPNGWNCRCDVDRVAYGAITPDDKINSPDVPKLFQTNLGKNGLVFPENHPYYKGFKLEDYLLKIPLEEQYIQPKGKNYKVHVLAHYMPKYRDKNSWGEILNWADFISEKKEVELFILSEIQNAEQLRKHILPNTKGRKNPDFLYNGNYADLKSPKKITTLESLRNLIDEGYKQTNVLMINLNDSPDWSTIEIAVYSRMNPKAKKDLLEIHIRNKDGEYRMYKKPN